MLLTALLLAAVPPGCNSPRSQVAINRCAAVVYRQADAAMTRQWKATYAFMKVRDARGTSRGGGFGYTAALLASQRAWLAYRDAECVIEGGRFAGGSVEPVAQAQCKTGLTNMRVRSSFVGSFGADDDARDADAGSGGVAPTLLRIGAHRFYFYSHEPNEPPHVHVDRGDATIKIRLDTLEVAKSRGFRAHEIGGIVALVEEHRASFLESWHDYFG